MQIGEQINGIRVTTRYREPHRPLARCHPRTSTAERIRQTDQTEKRLFTNGEEVNGALESELSPSVQNKS